VGISSQGGLPWEKRRSNGLKKQMLARCFSAGEKKGNDKPYKGFSPLPSWQRFYAGTKKNIFIENLCALGELLFFSLRFYFAPVGNSPRRLKFLTIGLLINGINHE